MDSYLCPKCQHSQTISARQLKKKHGKIKCPQCQHKFNARASLSYPPHRPDETAADELYAWQKTPVHHSKRWVAGSFLGLLLLAYQIAYFSSYPLAQNPKIRPWLSYISGQVNYPLPTYRNLSEFTTIGSSFTPVNTDNYRVQISIINQADFDQHLPDIFVSLHNLYGGLVAQKVFTPQEYLAMNKTQTLIKSSATVDIDFFIAVPEQEIGGYSIALQ